MTGVLSLAGLTGIWPTVAGAVGAAVLVAGMTHWLDSNYYERQLAEQKSTAAVNLANGYKASLDTFVHQSQIIVEAAKIFQTQQSAYKEKLDAINAAFTATAAADPLPRGCSPPTSRLHSLSDAISAANAAISSPRSAPGKPLPAPSHTIR